MLSICGNSFKTVGKKPLLMKLVERMPRACKAVIKAKGGDFEESKIYLCLNIDLFNTWLLHDSMCYFVVLMSSLLFYNVENSTK